MTIVSRFSSINMEPKSPTWPNKRTLLVSFLVVSHLACTFFDAPVKAVVFINLSARAAVLVATNYDRRFEGAFQLFAIGLLFTPHGYLAACIADIISEAFCSADTAPLRKFNFKSHLTDRLDPRIPKNALRILNIPEGHEKDVEYIKKSHAAIVEGLSERRTKIPGGVAGFLDELIRDANDALATLQG